MTCNYDTMGCKGCLKCELPDCARDDITDDPQIEDEKRRYEKTGIHVPRKSKLYQKIYREQMPEIQREIYRERQRERQRLYRERMKQTA